jgi:ricin-type beta-trefoil lectin protein
MVLSIRRLVTTVIVVAAALVPLGSASASALPAPPAPGAYRLYSGFHQQCLGGRADHVVSLAECQVAFADQVWVVEALPLAGYYRFRNQFRNECLAFPSGANGSEARISSCVDSFDDQWWTFLNTIPSSDAVLLRNHKTGKCLVDRKANGRATESDCVLNFQDQWWSLFAAS